MTVRNLIVMVAFRDLRITREQLYKLVRREV